MRKKIFSLIIVLLLASAFLLSLAPLSAESDNIITMSGDESICRGNTYYGKNKHICDTCGRKLSDHEGGTATCSEKATCTICGEKYGDFAGHSFGEWKTDADGKRTKVCSACGKVANFMYGDLNYDGKVNTLDLMLLRRFLRSTLSQ